MSTIPTYKRQSLEGLGARTQYESWLLEAVYNVVGTPIIEDWPDQVIYPADGGLPQFTVYGRSNGTLFDWRPQFLNVGAPLVFVTSFKLLDMILEWVLEQNETKSTYRFSEKKKALKKGVVFPPFFDTRNWFRDRIIGLYEHLEPLRGAIIHSRHFKTTDGTLRVSSSKTGDAGREVTITAVELRSLAVIFVSLLRYIDGSWVISGFTEKHLRRSLDDLVHLHHLPFLCQKIPISLTVRVYADECDLLEVDLKRIKDDIAHKYPDHDVVLNLRVVTINKDGSPSVGYLFPWEEIKGEKQFFRRSISEITHFKNPLPDDIDTECISK